MTGGEARAALEAAYANANYCVRLPYGDLILKIGQRSAAADERLRKEADVRQNWAILTPCNPRSQPLGATANALRLHELGAALGEAGLRSIPGVNRDPGGEWPDEPSFFICDPPASSIDALARRFGQNAFVSGRLGEPAELIWI